MPEVPPLNSTITRLLNRLGPYTLTPLPSDQRTLYRVTTSSRDLVIKQHLSNADASGEVLALTLLSKYIRVPHASRYENLVLTDFVDSTGSLRELLAPRSPAFALDQILTIAEYLLPTTELTYSPAFFSRPISIPALIARDITRVFKTPHSREITRVLRDLSTLALVSPPLRHGDLHPGNILLTEPGLTLIDPHLTIGPLEADLARLACSMYIFNALDLDLVISELSSAFHLSRRSLEIFTNAWLAQIYAYNYSQGAGSSPEALRTLAALTERLS